MYRQGDVLIVPVAAKPEDARQLDREEGNRVVLAHGEVTGHAHAIYDEGAEIFAVDNMTNYNDGTRSQIRAENTADNEVARFLEVTADSVSLKHEEHDTINLKQGTYRVIRQREYTPEDIRIVAD